MNKQIRENQGVEIRQVTREQGGNNVTLQQPQRVAEDFPVLGLLGGKQKAQQLQQQKHVVTVPVAVEAPAVFEAVQIATTTAAATTAAATTVAAAEPQPQLLLNEDEVFREEADIVEVASFDDMGLKENLIRGIYAKGFEKPTAIQRKAILPLSRGRDVIGQAQAGTGKTGAFCIAALQRLDETKEVCQALVIAPATELALQSNSVMTQLGSQMGPIKSACFYGGEGAPSELDNRRTVKAGIHTAVCTPGRIVALVKKGILSLQNVKMLIIDEADEMLKIGHQDNLRYIVNHIPKDCTIALFSATMPRAVLEVAKEFLRDPLQILVVQYQTALQGVKQYFAEFDKVSYKTECLHDLLAKCRFSQAIVFVNTKERAEELFRAMSARNHSCTVIHGDMTKPEREASDRRFRGLEVKVLIATDVISRGYDVETVEMVVNYDIPDCYTSAEGTTGGRETYVHRIGRTGRSNRRGRAVNFVFSKRDEYNLRDIAHYYHCAIDPLPGNLNNI